MVDSTEQRLNLKKASHVRLGKRGTEADISDLKNSMADFNSKESMKAVTLEK